MTSPAEGQPGPCGRGGEFGGKVFSPLAGAVGGALARALGVGRMTCSRFLRIFTKPVWGKNYLGFSSRNNGANSVKHGIPLGEAWG